MTNDAVNMRVQISVQVPAFKSFECIPRSGIAGSCSDSVFYTAASPFYNPTNDAQGFQFLHILANTPNGCEVVSHSGFDLYFPNSH